MIKLIYGPSGSGKTHTVLKALKNDASNSQKALLIVPEQMAVSAEKSVLELMPPKAQLYVEVVNFSRLANKIFRIYGGLTYDLAPKALQKLIMWQAIVKAAPFLCEYTSNGKDDMSLANAMLATYKELSASGISLDSLSSAVNFDKNSLLYNKIKDISTICSIYSAMLTERFSDENNELIRLSKVIEEHKCLSGYNVYIDGFTSLTGLEHKIVRAIMAQAQNVYITLPISSPQASDIDSVSIKRFSDKLRRDIASLGLKCETVNFFVNHRTDRNDLAFVAENLWALDSTEQTESIGSIELWKCADIYDECETAAAKARELVESGYNYRDIAIIARNADKYRGIIEPALDSMELKYFISEKTDPALCPASRLILSALRIANFGWRREDVISHLKTGLCCISPRDCDIFESYVAKWNLSGKRFIDPLPWNMNPDGYTDKLTERGKEILDISNKVKNTLYSRLSKYIFGLKNAESCRDLCVATYNYLEELDVNASLKELSARFLKNGKLKEASEAARMYDVILDALDCVCDAFANNEKPDLLTFSVALKTALEESELGSIPTSADEIMIGSANMLRADNVKCAIIIGACDGEFPADAQNVGLLSDADRDVLISNNIKISGDRELRASDELFYFKRAVATPSEKLIVFTRSDSQASIAFSRISTLTSIEPVHSADRLLYKIRTAKTISEYLPLLKDTDEGQALEDLLKETGNDEKYSIANIHKQPLSAENDNIDPAILKNLLGPRLTISQSKIEKYINCRFAYSCKYYLKLNEDQKASFAFNNVGTLVHHVLEKYLMQVFINNNGVESDTLTREAAVDSIIEDYISALLPDDGQQRSARLLHLIERLKKLSLLVINDIMNELSDSDFIPRFFELPIGSKEIPAIHFKLNDGTLMSLSGVVDRVDTFKKDGNVYIKVIDYKTGSKTFSIKDIESGSSLQLLLYIYSLTQNKDKTFIEKIGGQPVAAAISYVAATATKTKTDRVDSPDSAIKNASGDIKRSGLILDDPAVIDAISRTADQRYLMKSSKKSSFISEEGFKSLFDLVGKVMTDIGNEITTGNVNAIPKDLKKTCKFCPYSLVCRNKSKIEY